MDEEIANFVAFTSATPQQAQQYLALTDNNVEQAVELFFNNPDLAASAPAPPPAQPAASRTTGSHPNDAIAIDDDDDAEFMDEDEGTAASAAAGHSVEDDEAMARRLQEEMYGSGGGGGGAGAGLQDEVRAPMARTTETLVGPGSNYMDDPGDMRAAVMEQMMARQNRRAAPGIFNQRHQPSIWSNDDPNDPERHRETLARATGGASESTSKSNLLAELFSPPVELMSHLPWEGARDEGKEQEKWILVNVQDPSIFDCQVLNRDIWKNAQIRDTVKENFIFMQFNKTDPRGNPYMNYYFHARDSEDAYPHIAIVDPRTGEQVKVWSGSPAPKPADFLMDLHEFLDRYSLKVGTKLPVATKKAEKKKDVGQMSEEEMLEMAMQNSLANGAGPKDSDPDALTKQELSSKGKGRAVDPAALETADTDVPMKNGNTEPSSSSAAKATPFSRISSTAPHDEPPIDPTIITRIQLRYSGGRIVRRFALTDPVRRIYEWLKASPLEGKEGVPFELIATGGKNLIESLDQTIEEAKLKNGTVMIEFLEGDE